MTTLFNTPYAAARFFIFLGYRHWRVVDYLKDRFKIDEPEAQDLTSRAERDLEAVERNDNRAVLRGERAVAAEHDLSRSTWTPQRKESHGD